MNIDTLTPTTIEGIKRLANKLKKANGIQQSAALDCAAAQAGFRNFREARRVLSVPPIVVVRITGHFREDHERKTLVTHVQLSRGIRSFLRPQDLRATERFHKMSIVADDHIQGHFGRADQTYVRQCMAKTARTLQFMDATGLKPSSAEIYPRRTYSRDRRIPGQDHAITWRDPRTKALVMMDEPYGYTNERARERADWASRNGYAIQRLEWGGTYFPEGQSVCDLVSHAEKGLPIGKVLEMLKKAAPGFRQSAAAWALHDGIYDEPTPGEIQEHEAKATANKGSGPIGQRAAARNGTSLTYGNGQKRPAGALPLVRHAEIGLILNRAGLVVSERPGARNALVSLRSMLESWANAETNGKLSNEDFFALYDGDVPGSSELIAQLSYGKPTADLKDATLVSLAQVREWLIEGYPDGAGRDRALKLVDKATTSLEGFQSRD